MRISLFSATLLFLFALMAVLAGCIERKPEQVKRRDSPVTGELTSIFKEQEAYRDAKVSSEVINERAVKQRQQIYQFLAQSLLVEPTDLYRAAQVLQSTDTATCKENFLLAYYMCQEAVRKGLDSARYLAATSIDRYLLASGLRQRYATQYGQDRFGRYYILPYDSTISDRDRTNYGVPAMDSLKKIVSHLNGTK